MHLQAAASRAARTVANRLRTINGRIEANLLHPVGAGPGGLEVLRSGALPRHTPPVPAAAALLKDLNERNKRNLLRPPPPRAIRARPQGTEAAASRSPLP